ncbi:uncharacterized protein TM35_000401240 [Trypanosoma theileri]|uniref:FHA domain-containing protein n=1 Tax=Trypanosoma theileri TaxID=67003 RepID=A0A1X0NJP6_9TRYP|nr:uncharacterized protein TM35_000401240 [Trypanosoma theileri]ORC84857.1 hypothetical protein TM35_000401240 [Trypanosoma theileri]
MVEYLNAALVLTRGSALLPRRLSVRVPIDGTPLSIGRAEGNDLVLDANLLFASQHHCQLIVRSVSTAAKETAGIMLEGKEDKNKEDHIVESEEKHNTQRHRNGARQKQKKQDQDQQHQQLELCLVDLGSSNGTFINDIRVENDSLTPLHHGDVIVLGGMRDVAAGASLPKICGPEIVTWRITFNDNDSPFAFEETPAVFLSPDYIEAEEKRMTLQLLLQQTAMQSPQRAVSPTANCDSMLKDAPPPTVVKGWCRNRDQNEHQQHQQNEEQQQQGEESPQTPVAREVLQDKENDDNPAGDGNAEIDTSTRRSGTVAAAIVLRDKSTEWGSPTTVPLRAVRLDRNSFNILQTPSLRPKSKRLRRQDTEEKADNNDNNKSSLQQHKLTLTQEQLEWTMSDGADIVKKKSARREQHQQCAVHCKIPWSNVERIMYCTSQQAITVLLREGTQTSLPGIGDKKNKNRFATWLVDEPKIKKKKSTAAHLHNKDTFQHLLAELSRFSDTSKRPKPQPLEEEEFIARYAPII